MRVCKVCGNEKALTEFPPYTVRGKTGFRYTCRNCWNAKWSPVIAAHQNRYYDTNANLRERVKARALRSHRENPAAAQRRNAVYAERHPEKAAAKREVMLAVRSGRLLRQPCSVCGAKKADAHHDNYSQPLNVLWLCRTHHGERHRMLNRKKRAGNLLDGRTWLEYPR